MAHLMDESRKSRSGVLVDKSANEPYQQFNLGLWQRRFSIWNVDNLYPDF